MKRAWVALAVLFLLLAGTVCASAVELTAGTICAYDKNILTVASEDGGRLTIEAWNGTLPLENIVTDLKTEPGTVEIPWDGLSWGGEPVPAGQIRLRATLACSDRTVEQTEITAAADTPLTAACRRRGGIIRTERTRCGSRSRCPRPAPGRSAPRPKTGRKRRSGMIPAAATGSSPWW